MSASHLLQESQQRVETIGCALIITRHAHSELLVVTNGEDFVLPRVEIPRWERAAPHLVSQVRKHWGIEAICLFSPQIHPQEAVSGPRYYALEAREGKLPLREGAAWIPAGENACHKGLKSNREQAALLSALSQAAAYHRGDFSGNFVGSGWFQELTAWMQIELSRHGLRLGEGWTQDNMGPDFCLLRLETNGPAVWFKAVGGPNLREYPITTTLAAIRSSHLPEILAHHPGWHGWVMTEADGCHLHETSGLLEWQNVAGSLASLQIESLGATDSLVASGCQDLRVTQLEPRIDSFLELVAGLMTVQPLSPPRILTRPELNFLEKRLRQACDRLGSMGFCDSLGHADLNPGNVIVNDDRAVFLDWAEATVSHPFFAFEYLESLFRRLRPDLESCSTHLREAYVHPWMAFYSEEQVENALKVAPLLAPLAFALGYSSRQERTPEPNSYPAKLIRSLARRMYGEALKLDAEVLK